MTVSVLGRILIALVVIAHGVWSYQTTGYDDILPIRVAYLVSVGIHVYHWVQWRLWVTRPPDEE